MTFLEILKMLNVLSPIVLFLGLVIGFYFYRSLNNVHKNIVHYLLIMLCVDITSRLFARYLGNNLIILLVFSLIEVSFFVYFYKKYLFKASHKILTGLGIAGILYIIAEILINFVFTKVDSKQFQPYAKVVDNFVVISLALGFFHEKINIFKESKWDNFKLNATILVFFTLNMIFFLPFNFLVNESTGLKFYFWLANLTITISFYLFLIYFLWKNGRTQK